MVYYLFMSFGMSDQDEKVLEGLSSMEYSGGAETGGYNPEDQEVTPDQAFNIVRNAIPMVQQETANGSVEVFDEETAKYNLATAVLIDDKKLKEGGVIGLQRDKLIKQAESPELKRQKDLLVKARESIGYVNLQDKIRKGEGSTLDREMMKGWNAIDQGMQNPPSRADAMETYKEYREKRANK